MPNYNYKVKLYDIKAFAFDVDGVLTDGSIISTTDGDLLRTFNAKDGFAIRICVQQGFPVGIITGGISDSILHRFRGVGIPDENICQKSRNKVPVFLDFCKRNGVKPEEVAYIGDDLPDIPVLKRAGLAVCPSDAVDEVKEICHVISPKAGGKGCVRELIEQILKVHGKWIYDPVSYADKWKNTPR